MPHEVAKLYPPIGKSSMSFKEYKAAYAASVMDPGTFWAGQARQMLEWFVPFQTSLSGDFDAGDVTWFAGGKLNVCYNAIDRHVTAGKGSQVAMVWEGDEPDDIKKLTYLDLQRKISKIANALTAQGVRKGDVVVRSFSSLVSCFWPVLVFKRNRISFVCSHRVLCFLFLWHRRCTCR